MIRVFMIALILDALVNLPAIAQTSPPATKSDAPTSAAISIAPTPAVPAANQKDLGANTGATVRAINAYNPDASWQKAAPGK